MEVGLLTYFALCPRTVRQCRLDDAPWTPVGLSREQRRFSDEFMREHLRLGRLGGVPAGEGRAQLSLVLQALRNMPLSSGSCFRLENSILDLSGKSGIDVVGQLRSVTAERIDMPSPGLAATIHCTPWMAPFNLKCWCSRERMYSAWAGLSLEEIPHAPDPAFLCSGEEFLRLIIRMRDAGMICVLDEGDVALSAKGIPLVASIFCISEHGQVLRLIADRRPQNFYEQSLTNLQLPNSSMFTQFVIPENYSDRLSLRDASSYYFRNRLPSARVPYNVLGTPISKTWWLGNRSDLPASGSAGLVGEAVAIHDRCRVALLCLGQGGLNGVLVGESIHRNILWHGRCFQPFGEMICGDPVPHSLCWCGICIDDVGIVQSGGERTFLRGNVLRGDEVLCKVDSVSAGNLLLEKACKRQRKLLSGKTWGGTLTNDDPPHRNRGTKDSASSPST